MSTKSTQLFPVPSTIPPSAISPVVWPGISPESTAALQSVLTDDYKKHHVFFNERGFHNHVTHHSLALWALGAPKPLIDAAYERDLHMQRPAFESPEPITTDNFNDHLGDERYYNAYMKFFQDDVLEKGISAALEKYIFSQKFNFDLSLPSGKQQPEMLSRFLSGLLHALIHTGHGAEFGLPGMLIEGLAQTAVHKAGNRNIIPTSLFKSDDAPLVEQVSSLSSQLKVTLLDGTTPAKPEVKGTHAFTVMARILKDPQFLELEDKGDEAYYSQVVILHGEALLKYANEWTLDATNPKEVERKIEELQWANVMIYAIPGWKTAAGKPINADFLAMHLVTSSLFIPSLAAYLSPRSLTLLLRSYFVASLAWWIARGRPSFDIPGFFAEDTSYPLPSGTLPTPPKWAFPSPSHPFAATPNPWAPLLQRTVTDPDDHLCKLMRALAHYGRLYGTRTAGLEDFSETELPGAEKLDGTLFIRAAGLTCAKETTDEFEWELRGYFGKH